MAVQGIEEYRMKNGNDILKVILKPTEKFPNGYFYTDASALDVVNKYTWYLSSTKHTCNIIAQTSRHNSYTKQTLAYFHRYYAECLTGSSVNVIDHINSCELDNIKKNIRFATYSSNSWNRPSKGYFYTKVAKKHFRVMLQGDINTREFYSTELEALQRINELRRIVYKEFDYDFKECMQDCLDILDDERTGKISHDEAIYKHVKRAVEVTPWYAFRYNLLEYCKENHIHLPDVHIDNAGFLVDLNDVRICPYK